MIEFAEYRAGFKGHAKIDVAIVENRCIRIGIRSWPATSRAEDQRFMELQAKVKNPGGCYPVPKPYNTK